MASIELIDENIHYRISKDLADGSYMIVFKCLTDGYSGTMKKIYRIAWIHIDQCTKNR